MSPAKKPKAATTETPTEPTTIIIERNELLQLQREMVRIQTLVESVLSQSEENGRILKGANGDPGLVQQMGSLQEKVQNHLTTEKTCPIWNLAPVLYGTPGDPTKPGIANDVQNLKEWKNSIRHWYLVLIGAVIVSMVQIIFDIIRQVANLPH